MNNFRLDLSLSTKNVTENVDLLSMAVDTEAGELLPCQVSTAMESKSSDIVRLTVTFFVDGEKVRVEGDKCEPAN